MLRKIAKGLTGSEDLALTITRGLPNNVTTEMDLVFWEIAQTIQGDSDACQHVQNSTPEELAEEYLNEQLPTTAQTAIDDFMQRYGMRGLGEIDLGRPRWREEPTQIMGILRSYLQIEDQSTAPDVLFRRAESEAGEATNE